jgi:hypothetical protein
MIEQLNAELEKETPLMVTQGTMHNDLGITIDYPFPGKVQVGMMQGMFVVGVLWANQGSNSRPCGFGRRLKGATTW